MKKYHYEIRFFVYIAIALKSTIAFGVSLPEQHFESRPAYVIYLSNKKNYSDNEARKGSEKNPFASWYQVQEHLRKFKDRNFSELKIVIMEGDYLSLIHI